MFTYISGVQASALLLSAPLTYPNVNPCGVTASIEPYLVFSTVNSGLELTQGAQSSNKCPGLTTKPTNMKPDIEISSIKFHLADGTKQDVTLSSAAINDESTKTTSLAPENSAFEWKPGVYTMLYKSAFTASKLSSTFTDQDLETTVLQVPCAQKWLKLPNTWASPAYYYRTVPALPQTYDFVYSNTNFCNVTSTVIRTDLASQAQVTYTAANNQLRLEVTDSAPTMTFKLTLSSADSDSLVPVEATYTINMINCAFPISLLSQTY